jgi:hypothetical protein
MSETINVEMPRRGVDGDLAETLASHGLHAELVEDGDASILKVTFAEDERQRLASETLRAIEDYLAERMLPLVVERADGGCVIRPPAD